MCTRNFFTNWLLQPQNGHKWPCKTWKTKLFWSRVEKALTTFDHTLNKQHETKPEFIQRSPMEGESYLPVISMYDEYKVDKWAKENDDVIEKVVYEEIVVDSHTEILMQLRHHMPAGRAIATYKQVRIQLKNVWNV